MLAASCTQKLSSPESLQITMDDAHNDGTAKHVFFFDNARSCSNLLGKLFSAQPELRYERHPYRIAMARGPESLRRGIPNATMKDLMQQASMVTPELAELWGSLTFAESQEALNSLIDGAERQV